MPELTLDWKKYKNTAIDIAREGSVLLKNDREALPVSKDSKIALFGRMQGNYYKSGTGSGGMVNVNHVYDIREGLKEAGAKTLTVACTHGVFVNNALDRLEGSNLDGVLSANTLVSKVSKISVAKIIAKALREW